MKTDTLFYCLVIAGVLMLVASFLVPPTGVIDPSVLKGSSVVLAFAALTVVYKALMKGVNAKLTHKNTTVAFQHNDEDDEPAQGEE